MSENEKVKIKPFDWLLIFGIVLSPMTSLRIWKIGPGELLCFIWSIRYFNKVIHCSFKNIIKKFWVKFFVVLLFGSIFGFLFYPDEFALKDIFTFIYFYILSIAISEQMKAKSRSEIENIFIYICAFSAFIYVILLGYSKYVSNSFWGMNLMYSNTRFSGGADNPHQLAVLIGASTIGLIRFLFTYKTSLFKKGLYTTLIVACFFIALNTKSSTLILSLIIALSICLYVALTKKLAMKDQVAVIFLSIMILLLICIIFNSTLLSLLYGWISDDPNGLGRLEIFKSIEYPLKKNFLFGIGPGVHGFDGTIEFHNTYLEIIAMSGIIGFIVFISFSIKLFKLLKIDKFLIAIVAVFYAYGLAGFAFRRLAYWGITAILVALAEKINESKKLKEIEEK